MIRGGVRVIARPGLADGFALAGLPVTELAAGPDAGSRIASLAHDDANALLLVDDTLLPFVSDEDRAELAKRAVPIIIPFPAPAWEEVPSEPAAYILALLQRAIGYRVRLQ
jgi:vacuolar-type H+-ATPase subunit F/Vma7